MSGCLAPACRARNKLIRLSGTLGWDGLWWNNRKPVIPVPRGLARKPELSSTQWPPIPNQKSTKLYQYLISIIFHKNSLLHSFSYIPFRSHLFYIQWCHKNLKSVYLKVNNGRLFYAALCSMQDFVCGSRHRIYAAWCEGSLLKPISKIVDRKSGQARLNNCG